MYGMYGASSSSISPAGVRSAALLSSSLATTPSRGSCIVPSLV